MSMHNMLRKGNNLSTNSVTNE